MSGRIAVFVLFCFVVGLSEPIIALESDGFKVIVNSSNPVKTLSKTQLSKLFMKKQTTWENGQPVVPVDLTINAAVRAQFSSKVLNKSTMAVKNYWQQQVFSGKDIPPLEKANESEVIAFVQNTPGGIGYLPEATVVQGVTVVTITD
jgi:ABC-type phosphate transport system substrate-binding protein